MSGDKLREADLGHLARDITEAWDRQKKARDDRFNAQQQPLVQPPPDE